MVRRDRARGRGEGGRRTPKSAALLTPEDWVQYGVGEPIDHDDAGLPIFADYRPPRAAIEAAAVDAKATGSEPENPGSQTVTIDITTLGLVLHWDLVIVDMRERFQIDMHSPAVLAQPWPHIRGYVLSLLYSETRLQAALIRR
ncbi:MULTISPECIES: hypothetical protein [unclassified Microbacterium]|uniref:hypothetical protein n=1 Tax=unclassified Microbacterium TaxID=2609290 RepID=UPI003C2CFA12